MRVAVDTQQQSATALNRRLSTTLATTRADVEAAQRLRYQIFVDELGARAHASSGRLDADLFDSYCDHLIVRDRDTGQVVGTYRLLPGLRAASLGTFYADQEFDLARLQHLRSRMVELGRACIHPAYRTGAVIMHLWAGIARYMRAHNYDFLIGCASIGMGDGGANALALYAAHASKHLAPIEYRVVPRIPLQVDAVVQNARWVALLGDTLYTLTLKLNHPFNAARARMGLPYWSLSQALKHKVKNAVRYITAFESALAQEARKRALDGVVCGRGSSQPYGRPLRNRFANPDRHGRLVAADQRRCRHPHPHGTRARVPGALDRDLRTAALAALDLDRDQAAAYGARFSWTASTDQFLSHLERVNS